MQIILHYYCYFFFSAAVTPVAVGFLCHALLADIGVFQLLSTLPDGQITEELTRPHCQEALQLSAGKRDARSLLEFLLKTQMGMW